MAPAITNGSTAKRTAQACERCRLRKVRCSGTQPCSHCQRQRKSCRYLEGAQRVSVGLRYLRELEAAAVTPAPGSPSGEQLQARPHGPVPPEHALLSSASPPAPPPAASAANPERLNTPLAQKQTQRSEPSTFASHLRPAAAGEASSSEFERNPLVNDRPFMLDAGGTQWFLGPSSTWSFSRRVIAHLSENRDPTAPSPPATNLDGTAYNLTWPRLADQAALDPRNLPSLDHAIYLFNTFKFHLGQIFHFVDELKFLHNLRLFYTDPSGMIVSSPLWCSQFLLVLAFGKAFLSRAMSSAASTPKGWAYASVALALIPPVHSAEQDNLLAIEVFCLAALYLQAIDMRVTAFEFVGRALRMCYVVGIHRGSLPDTMDRTAVERCNYLWWSVYMLDQHLSALMGAPSPINDDDMTVPLPSVRDVCPRAAALGLHVHLSRLLARLLRTVYGVQSSLDGSFLSEAQNILRRLAEVSREIDSAWVGRLENSAAGGESQLSSHLRLYYHHCIVLATRPLIMCIVVHFTQGFAALGKRRPITLSNPVSALLQASIDSATAIIKILYKLKDDDMLELFLPFHLEQAFSSAFILCIISAILPESLQDHSLHSKSTEILESMISDGNNLARLRKIELDHLNSLLAQFGVNDIRTGEGTVGIDVDSSFSLHRRREDANETAADSTHDDLGFGWEFDFFAADHSNDLNELASLLDIDNMASHIMFDVS